MNDEKYLTLSNESVSTNRGLYTSDPSVAPTEVKFKRAQQVLVGIAVSEKDISKPFFTK